MPEDGSLAAMRALIRDRQGVSASIASGTVTPPVLAEGNVLKIMVLNIVARRGV